MASVFRLFQQGAFPPALGAAVMAVAAAAAWISVAALPRHDDQAGPPAEQEGLVLSAGLLTAMTDTQVFEAPDGAGQEPTDDAFARRFRLAGTFFVLSSDLSPAARKAVLVDRASGNDHIVRQGDVFQEIEVLTVAQDHVVLRKGERSARLNLGGRRTDTAETTGAGAGAAPAAPAPENGASRFGDRIHDNRYVFHRDRLLDYYTDVMQSPQRLKQVFDSMKPLYDDDNAITGYVLDIEGEAGFFEDVGLREGDVVRSVNDMAMSNRRRAEYLIGEFALDRLNVFVLDIERDGQPVKLIYELR